MPFSSGNLPCYVAVLCCINYVRFSYRSIFQQRGIYATKRLVDRWLYASITADCAPNLRIAQGKAVGAR